MFIKAANSISVIPAESLVYTINMIFDVFDQYLTFVIQGEHAI